MSEKTEFKDLASVLAHFTTSGEDVEKKLALYRSQVTELTGHDLSKPLTALDVVRIVQKVFFGAKHAASDAKPTDSALSGCDVVYKSDPAAPPVQPAQDTGSIDAD